jgi:hypothetical protein
MLIISGTLINRLSILMVEYSENPSIPSREETLLRLQAARVPKQKKTPKPIAKVSVKKAKQIAEEKKELKGDKTDLHKWYTKIMESEEPKCWETGERLNKADKLGWHGSVAHILCKSLYPSVATHPQNYMILSMWNGSHANYDSSWEKAAKMKVWPYALKIILTVLVPLLTPEEKRKLPEIIVQEIDPLKK